MIVATVGNHSQPFFRLFNWLENWENPTNEKIICQAGSTSFQSDRMIIYDYIPSAEEFLSLRQSARLLVMHAGLGSIIEAMDLGVPALVLARRVGLKEHIDDHQMEMKARIEEIPGIYWVGAEHQLHEFLNLENLVAPPPPRGAAHIAKLIEDTINKE